MSKTIGNEDFIKINKLWETASKLHGDASDKLATAEANYLDAKLEVQKAKDKTDTIKEELIAELISAPNDLSHNKAESKAKTDPKYKASKEIEYEKEKQKIEAMENFKKLKNQVKRGEAEIEFMGYEAKNNKINLLINLVSESAPMHWVANEDIESANAWEIRASKLLKDIKEVKND